MLDIYLYTSMELGYKQKIYYYMCFIPPYKIRAVYSGKVKNIFICNNKHTKIIRCLNIESESLEIKMNKVTFKLTDLA